MQPSRNTLNVSIISLQVIFVCAISVSTCVQNLDWHRQSCDENSYLKLVSEDSKHDENCESRMKDSPHVLSTKGFVKSVPNDLKSSYVYDFEGIVGSRFDAMSKYDFPYNIHGVDRRSGLTVEEFYEVYDGKWPVIVTDVVKTWPAYNWTLEFLQKQYRSASVSVIKIHKGLTEGLFMSLGAFISQISQGHPDSWMYLQDELFLMQRPSLKKEILGHVYEANNLFDLFPEEIRPWDCFFLLGSAYSHSHLHIDPYNWTATSAVIFGHKKWKLFPPGQDALLNIPKNGKCGFPLDCRKYNSPFNAFGSSDQLAGVQVIETEAKAGDMLIIPTGWFHQAYNEVPTLAISGQIMNENNHLAVLEEILKANTELRQHIACDFNTLSPTERVKHIMSNIPQEVLQRGAEQTKQYLAQINDNDETHS